MNYILKNARIIDPSAQLDTIGDIGVKEGRLAEPSECKGGDVTILDMKKRVVAPGLIDLHVHLRHPGKTAAETIRTGTQAAAAGGFTSIVAMPNTTPAADNPGTIEYVRTNAAKDGVVNVLPCGAMTKNLEGREMSGIGALKLAGVVALSDDGRCIQDHNLMRHVVEYSRSFQLPILDHCGDANLEAKGVMHEGYWSTMLGMKGMTSAAEELMIARDIMIARMTDWKIHVQHVSSIGSVKLIREARRENIRITGEATPHHIALTDAEIKKFDSNYKMNPPLRSEEDRQALLTGLADGTLTVIATDHAPHTATEKLVEFDYAPFGIIGLETAVPICMTELVHTGILTLPQLIAKFTSGPADVLGLPIGTLKMGSAADLTVLDPDFEFTINPDEFKSKSRNSPFGGYQARGRAVCTIVGGKIVHNLL